MTDAIGHIYTENAGKFDIWRGSKWGYRQHIATVTAPTVPPAERIEIAQAICVGLDADLIAKGIMEARKAGEPNA